MPSPALEIAASSTRGESAVRELARAKVRAQAEWEAFCKTNRTGLTEDEAIERELESKRLCIALNAADYALHKAVMS